MSALLSRNAGSRPGVTGTARVDRDIDRLLRRINPGDIVVMDALDLDRITADALVHIITAAGPFVRDLNLRGCVQLREQWSKKGLVDACRNLENFSLEGCRIDRTSIHCFLLQNKSLVHVNLSGLAGATNAAMKILATHCPRVEHLNVSWCNNIDARGIRRVVTPPSMVNAYYDRLGFRRDGESWVLDVA